MPERMKQTLKIPSRASTCCGNRTTGPARALRDISETYRTAARQAADATARVPSTAPTLHQLPRTERQDHRYYVPRSPGRGPRRIQAWSQLQDRLRRLAQLNRERLAATIPRKKPLLQQALISTN